MQLINVKRLTVEDYDNAIADLQLGKTQLVPDGNNCVICGDSGHMAWECHHNPLVLFNEWWEDRERWRCFHCGIVFNDYEEAKKHFGDTSDSKTECLI